MIEDLDRELQETARLADSAPMASADELRHRGDRRKRHHRAAWLGIASTIVVGVGLAAGLSLSQPPAHRVSVVGGSTPSSTTAIAPASPVELNPSNNGSLLPAETFLNGRVMRTIVLDGGTLRIEPSPPGLTPGLPLEGADSIVKAAQTYNQGAFLPSYVGFGLVDLSTTLSGGLPAYTSRPAWIAILGPQSQVGVSCPGALPGGTSVPPRPIVHVVILDAQTGGDVLDYRSKGNRPCGGPLSGPSVQRAQEIVSVPWTAVGQTPVSQQQLHQLFPPNASVPSNAVNWVIRYTIPPCATVFDSPGIYDVSGPNHPVLYVDAQVPISPPSSCPAPQTVTKSFGPETVPLGQAQHAPTGLAAGPEL